MFVAVNNRDEKISSGSMGARERRSTTTNSTMPMTPTSSDPQTTGDANPLTGHAIRPKVTPARPVAASAAPGTSRWCAASGSDDSGTWRRASITTAAASGRLSRNTHRQPAVWTS